MRQRTRRTAPEVLAAIEALAQEYELANAKPNAEEIHRKLEAGVRANRFPRGVILPAKRTIRAILSDRSPEGDSEPWQPTHTDLDDVALVLPALARLIEETEGRRKQLTIAEARLIVAIRRAAPSLDPWTAFRAAREYIQSGQGWDPVNVDAFLAFAPWLTPEARARYEAALKANWIAKPYVFMTREMEEIGAWLEALKKRRETEDAETKALAEGRFAPMQAAIDRESGKPTGKVVKRGTKR